MEKRKNKYFKTNDVITYLAGAGCGKTTSLMEELSEMLKEYNPDEIAFVSFSRKASAEVRNRAELLGMDYSPDSFPYFRTLHALCYMLNDYSSKGKSIISKADAEIFAKVTNMPFSIHERVEGNRNKEVVGQLFFDLYALERSTGREPDYHLVFPRRRYEEFKELYELFKKQARVIDYHDCLSDYLKEGETIKKIKVAFIDEAQDLTIQQWGVCFKAFAGAKHIRIAGDDWQSIFAFQGASPQMFIDVAETGKIVKLEESYRLPKAVAKLAEKIVQTIDNKIDKHCLTKKEEEGEIKTFTEFEYLLPLIEADEDDTWYLLLRLNFQIQRVAEILRSKMILFHYSESFCIPEKYLLKLKSFYKWSSELQSPSDTIEFCRKNWIQVTEDGHWPLWWHTNLIPNPKLRETMRKYEERHGFDAIWKAFTSKPRILITTVFKVKGGEADRVVVFTASSRKVEEGRIVDHDNEARVMYTSVTRAKKSVYFTGLKGNVNSDYITALL
jgi:superfamily I DNA/RNA helicase